MNQHTIAADLLALDASNAGEHLWRAIELAAPHMKPSRLVLVFQCALEQIMEEMDCAFAAKLFEANARLALRTMADANERSKIDNAASDAWMEYVRFLEAEAREEAADFANDLKREVA